MKKILMSLLTVAMVGALITGGAIAMFSDVETAPGTFTAGTIDIAVGDGENFENPWTESFTIALDGKPSQVWYIEFVIENVGTNPCVIWKHLTNFETSDGEKLWPEASPLCSSEPEFVACGGEFWGDGSPKRVSYEPVNNIHKWILYDLYSEVILPIVEYPDDMDQWHQTEFDENETLKTVKSNRIILGSLPPGGQMRVIQSYHLTENAGNKYQGDTLTFDIELYAQQMEGTTLLLENKAESLYAGGPAKVGFDDDDDNVLLDDPDDTWGKLTYNTVGSSFDYTFEAVGLTASTDYCLIYYADPWDDQDPTTLIDIFTTNPSGDIALTPGSYNLEMDLPCYPDGAWELGAKIWLVECTDLVDGATKIPGDRVVYWNWGNLDNNLTETHLIWYDDTDIPDADCDNGGGG